MTEKYTPKSDTYTFRTDWFECNARPIWDGLLPAFERLESYLEIGSFEGNSACYMIDRTQGDFEITCVDSWEGAPGIIPDALDMSDVEKNFHENIAVAIAASPHNITTRIIKSHSDKALAQLFVEGKEYDLVYVDANHEGWQVLCDAVLAYRLCAIGGTIIFDDYTSFYNSVGDQRFPNAHTQDCKDAIDAFVNLHAGRLHLLAAPLRQFIVQKVG